MHEIVGDLFSHSKSGPDAVCITTNGFVNDKGACTMGRGSAGEAKKRWPGIELALGKRIEQEGNHVYLLTEKLPDHVEGNELQLGLKAFFQPDKRHVHYLPYHLVSFPVKPGTCTYNQLLPRYKKTVILPEEDRDKFAYFEPIHGTAWDMAGEGVANPIGSILSAKLMLEWLKREEETRLIEAAICRILEDGKVMTPDLGGSSSTSEVGDAIAALVAGEPPHQDMELETVQVPR